jgi:nucleoside-diphosphate-sugar epimerase
MTQPIKIPLPVEYADLAGQKILVTGAAGFIGGNLFQRLTSYGLDVTGTVLFENEAQALRDDGYDVRILDLASDDPWDELLAGVDIVFHVAAMFQEVEHGREAYDKVNHLGALKLAKTASRAGVSRFVHCSTVGVHGSVREIPATEETPFNPMDEYHETKLAGELAILEYGRKLPSDGMTVVVNRPAMVYGPGDMRMLKLFDRTLTKHFRMIGSGTVLAHLGYIEDQTDSFLLCAIAPRERVHCEAFNIASGEPVTLNELVAQIASVGGVSVPRLHVPVAPVWFAALLCELACKPFGIKPPLFRRRVGFFTHDRAFDLSKAEKRLGYRSRYDLKDGVTSTIDWYRRRNLIPG